MASGMMTGPRRDPVRPSAADGSSASIARWWMGGLIALIAALAVGFFVFRAITRPIDQLTRRAHQLAQGDLSARVAGGRSHFASGYRRDQRTGRGVQHDGEHLQHAERVRRDMTADIAHELRTPLTVMRGNLEAMLDGVYPFDAEHLTP